VKGRRRPVVGGFLRGAPRRQAPKGGAVWGRRCFFTAVGSGESSPRSQRGRAARRAPACTRVGRGGSQAIVLLSDPAPAGSWLANRRPGCAPGCGCFPAGRGGVSSLRKRSWDFLSAPSVAQTGALRNRSRGTCSDGRPGGEFFDGLGPSAGGSAGCRKKRPTAWPAAMRGWGASGPGQAALGAELPSQTHQ
jgi:hypothetical protein